MTGGAARRTFLRLGFAAWLVAPGAAAAATVGVTVIDEDGSPVGGAEVGLQSLDAGRFELFRRAQRATTDGAGRCELTGVEPGQYAIAARTSASTFVEPEQNALAGPVAVTIERPEETVRVRVELHRGTRLCTRFVLDGSRLDVSGKVRRHELETGFAIEEGLRREEDRCVQLFAGRWEIGLEPPRGYLLVGLEVDRDALDGHLATLDVRPGSPASFVTWSLLARARLAGRVSFAGERCSVTVRAELLEGNDWRIDADRRGGSLYTPVEARPDPTTGDYEMDLPDGRWHVAPVGESLESAEPASVVLDIASGEVRPQDFTIRCKGSDGGATLSVFVEGPGGERVEEAVVELWPAEPAERGREPIARKRPPAYGAARFENLSPGPYRLVAGQATLRENARTIRFDPQDRETLSQTIALLPAAELHVRVEPDGDRDAIGAAVRLERDTTTPLETELGNAQLLAALEHPSATVDATHRVRVRGIYPGTYAVSASGDDLFLEFRDDGEWVKEVELNFGETEVVELDARVVPASLVTAHLFCAGGEPLPSQADARLVPSTARPVDPLDDAWEREVRLARRVTLGVRGDDELALGPLDPGSWLVALRPATFDRWTWASGTENGHEAQSVEIARGERTGLGHVAIDCAPAIRVTLDVQSGAATPDLSGTRLDEELTLHATLVTPRGERVEPGRPTLERHRRLLVLRGLAEGVVAGELRLAHPHFVPEPSVRVELAGELVRGRTLDVRVPVSEVGSAVEVELADPAIAAGRLIAADGTVRVAPATGSRLWFPNLRAGSWRLELCESADCAGALREAGAVEVEAHVTLELRR